MIQKSLFLEKEVHERTTEENPFWMSIGDLMSGLLLVFVLLLLVVLLSLAKQFERSKNTRESLFKSLQEELQSRKIKVEVDPQQGTITIKDDILFDFNQTVLKDEGKEFLQRFIPSFASVLFLPNFRKEISRILIEGHTDRVGTSQVNLMMSLRRSFSVASYLISDECPYRTTADRQAMLQSILPSGRGKLDAEIRFTREKDRRVIFRIQFKETELIESWDRLQEGIRHYSSSQKQEPKNEPTKPFHRK